ncbi:hypothetical protein ACQI4E_21900 [Streptomyces sp. CA-252508]|uniref:hypothetical protein n=1 Tax=Streptomyces sp. CA-252508 TaxID=3418946 RepID=UPI003D9042F5
MTTNAHAATLTRFSGNDCTMAQFEYIATREQGSSNYYITFRYGYIHWPNAELPSCGPLSEPYSGVLQWKGLRNGQPFGWTTVPGSYMHTDGQSIPSFSGGGYRDVRFRACNWNTNTGFVGTCGSG